MSYGWLRSQILCKIFPIFLKFVRGPLVCLSFRPFFKCEYHWNTVYGLSFIIKSLIKHFEIFGSQFSKFHKRPTFETIHEIETESQAVFEGHMLQKKRHVWSVTESLKLLWNHKWTTLKGMEKLVINRISTNFL